MRAYGLPRNHNACDWDERGCKSSVNKISSKRRRTSRRIFKKAYRLENKRNMIEELQESNKEYFNRMRVLTKQESRDIVYTSNRDRDEYWLDYLDDNRFQSGLLDK